MNETLTPSYSTHCTGCWRSLDGLTEREVSRHLFWCGLPMFCLMVLLPVFVVVLLWKASKP